MSLLRNVTSFVTLSDETLIYFLILENDNGDKSLLAIVLILGNTDLPLWLDYKKSKTWH